MRFGIREILFVMLLLGIPVAAYFLNFRMTNSDIAEARSEVRRDQMKLQQLKAATKDMSDLDDEIALLAEKIALAEQKLPAQREVEVILEEVWKLASEHDLVPDSVRTDKITSKPQYAELPIKMKISGDFDGFYEFLLALEKLPRITHLPTMKLKKKSDTEGHMTANIVLSIFFEGTEKSSRGRAAGGKQS